MDELTLHRYLDGRLAEPERAAVDAALRSDPASRRKLDALREEANLIGLALETRAEPSRRIGDKVIAQLHLEERSRAAKVRTKKLFRRVAFMTALAASLAVCFFLVKPRTPAGSFLSGTHATIAVHGEKRDAKQGANVYDSDEIETAKGQFIRVGLANGQWIDVDEFSTLTIEKSGGAPVLGMKRGRIGVAIGEQQPAVQIELPQGVVTVQPGSRADIWMPQQAGARVPELFFAPVTAEKLAQNALVTDAIVTVFKGYAQIVTDKNSASFNAQAGVRSRVSKTEIQSRLVNIAGSRVLDMRGDAALYTHENLAPIERTLLGLMEKPRFETLGRNWGLINEASPRVGEALKQLDAAMQIANHVERAEKIAAGQQALHQACETLSDNDDRRRIGLTLEGMAHFEDGMARLAAGSRKDSDPHTSFDAARFAFDSALAVDPAMPASAAADWRSAFTNGSAPALATLPPEAQAALAASFRRAITLYWNAQIVPPQLVTLECPDAVADTARNPEAMHAAAEAFAKLHDELGHSIEGVAALLGEALCDIHAGDAASRRKALDALHLIVSKPVVGTDGAARQAFESICQAALVELIRVSACGSDAQKTLDAAHDFELEYPLDLASPLAKDVRMMLVKGLEAQKISALSEKRYDNAVEACTALLIALDEADGHWLDAGQNDSSGIRHVGVRLDLLDALVGAKDWVRAASEAHQLSGRLPSELQPRFNALDAQIRAKK